MPNFAHLGLSILKQLNGILFLLCILVPIMGTYAWLHYQREQIHEEVKQQILSGIDREELVVFKFSLADSKLLDWKEDREFAYQGQMYDVVESRIMADSIQYWCWWDQKESQIEKQIEECTARLFHQNPQQQHQQEKLHDFYKNLYHPVIPEWLLLLDAFQKGIPSNSKHLFTSHQLPPPVPPPETSCSKAG